MTKKNLFKIIAIAFLLFMLVGLLFFRKGGDEVLNPNPAPADDRQINNPDEKHKLTEEEKAKIFAENFVVTYYSYTWGNFSNVESQYYYMTEEMKSREKIKVEKMKREIEGQPQRYFTARARLLGSEITEFVRNEKISLNISLEIKEFNGAYVMDDDVIEIKPLTTALIDGNKKIYSGNIEDLIINASKKNIKINLIKIGNKWKVDMIEKK